MKLPFIGSDMYDVYLVLGIVGVTVIMVLLSRMGVLPKKSAPYIFVALVGAIWLGVVRKKRIDHLMEEYNRRKAEADKTKKELTEMEKKFTISEAKRREIIAQEQNKIAALEKEMLMTDAKEREVKATIDTLKEEDLHKEFDDLLARRAQAGRVP